MFLLLCQLYTILSELTEQALCGLQKYVHRSGFQGVCIVMQDTLVRQAATQALWKAFFEHPGEWYDKRSTEEASARWRGVAPADNRPDIIHKKEGHKVCVDDVFTPASVRTKLRQGDKEHAAYWETVSSGLP